jgi:hypothetical protein
LKSKRGKLENKCHGHHFIALPLLGKCGKKVKKRKKEKKNRAWNPKSNQIKSSTLPLVKNLHFILTI